MLINMLLDMRTTIDLLDALFAKAKNLVRARGTTLRALTIEGLQSVLDRAERKKPFRLRGTSHGKGGLVEELAATDWDEIRDISYQGRGG